MYYGFDAGIIKTIARRKTMRDLSFAYTHTSHQRSFGDAGRLMSGVTEGLAEYVADDPSIPQMRAAVRPGAIIPIVDTRARVYKHPFQAS